MRAAGTIIYLNGSSSAGKTTLARALQETLDEPYLDVGIDTLFGAVTPRFNLVHAHGSPSSRDWRGTAWLLDADGRVGSIEFDEAGRAMVHGLHAMVAALANVGNHVIVDDVMFEADFARHAGRLLAPLDAFLIGVRCPLDVLEARERARGDRLPGLARYLHRRPHAHVPLYDLEVDSSAASPEACARAIVDRIRTGPPPRAFRTLAAT